MLKNGAAALAAGGRLALLELQLPDKWLEWMASLAVTLMKPFGVKDEWIERRPWEIIHQTMNELLSNLTVVERYLGLTYIIAGEKSPEKTLPYSTSLW